MRTGLSAKQKEGFLLHQEGGNTPINVQRRTVSLAATCTEAAQTLVSPSESYTFGRAREGGMAAEAVN